jgi:hypothetical protein
MHYLATFIALLLLLLLLLQEYLLCGFDFVLAPLVQPGHEQPALQLPQDGSAVEPRIREELMLTSASWGGQVRVMTAVQ